MTIFDYEATPQELSLLHVDSTNKEEYLKKTFAKKILQDLYVLFRMRDDYIRAGKIRKKLFEKAA